jgi:hypothetical protein
VTIRLQSLPNITIHAGKYVPFCKPILFPVKSIVRRLTEAMQGTVTLESTPGVGSCFTVRLPLLMDRPQRVKL